MQPVNGLTYKHYTLKIAWKSSPKLHNLGEAINENAFSLLVQLILFNLSYQF